MRNKLGLLTESKDDLEQIQTLLQLMQKHATDFTITFRSLYDFIDETVDDSTLYALFDFNPEFSTWFTNWQQRIQSETIDKTKRLVSGDLNPQ